MRYASPNAVATINIVTSRLLFSIYISGETFKNKWGDPQPNNYFWSKMFWVKRKLGHKIWDKIVGGTQILRVKCFVGAKMKQSAYTMGMQGPPLVYMILKPTS